MESFVDAFEPPEAKAAPKAKPKPVPKVPAAVSNKRKVEVRRRLEDLSHRVPSYYIEDDDY